MAAPRIAHETRGLDSATAPTPRPLGVLIIIDDLSIGGAQVGLLEELTALDPERIRAHVVTLAEVTGINLTSNVQSLGIPVTRLAGHGLRDPLRFAALVRMIRRVDPDVVHAHLEYATILGTIAARVAGRPAVVTLRSVVSYQTRLEFLKRALQTVVLRWFATRVCVLASSAVDESKQNFGLARTLLEVLPNSINLDRLRLPPDFSVSRKRQELGIPSRGRVICTPARLDPVKGHRYLVEAAAALVDKRSDVVYVFAGAGSEGDRTEEQRLRAQVAELHLEDRILFLGERSDVPEIVAASDLFVLPSLMEGLSRAILEAMALGTPVIATGVGGNGDVLRSGETGWSVPPGQPEALAAAIDDALADPVRSSAMANRARELVESEFSTARHVKRLEELYREVSGRPTAQAQLAS